jgi:hypothetical protein
VQPIASCRRATACSGAAGSAGRPALTGTRLIDELINEARNGDIGDMSGARARVIGQTAISGALDWAQRSGMKMPKW